MKSLDIIARTIISATTYNFRTNCEFVLFCSNDPKAGGYYRWSSHEAEALNSALHEALEKIRQIKKALGAQSC